MHALEGMLWRFIDHMLVVWSLCPTNDFAGLVACSMTSDVAENMALYPLSQNCAMDSKALFFMSGNKWQRRAAMGICGMSRSAVWVASIDMLFGNSTVTPGAQRFMLVQCTFVPKKWLVHPELAIAAALCCNIDAANAYRLCVVLFTI